MANRLDFCKKISQGISFYDDISRFFFDFHLLLISGTQILEGLEICGDKFKKNKKLSVAIKQIKNEVFSGSEIFDAFAKHSNLFNKAVISLIKVGEETGCLDDQCMNIAEILNKQLLHRQISNKKIDLSKSVSFIILSKKSTSNLLYTVRLLFFNSKVRLFIIMK